MSLKTLMDKMARVATKQFDSVAVDVAYKSQTVGNVYDPVTDTMNVTNKSWTFRAQKLAYEVQNKDFAFSATGRYTEMPVSQTTAKLLFARLDVADDFEPEVGDTMILNTRENWKVLDRKSPPGSAIYTLVIERVS